MEFDFDAWAKLAKEDPAEFERRREAMLRRTIEAAPSEHRQRLEGLQFQLNMERRRAGTPLGACVRLNSLMWAGFHRLRKELNDAASGIPDPSGGKRSAEIIPLHAARPGTRRAGSEDGE
jgi:hypothetical protein